MKITEENRDLSSIDANEYYLVQCITADFAKSTGMIIEFDRKDNIKSLTEKESNKIIRNYPNESCILYDNRVFNLITKSNYNKKATYESIKDSLINMRKIIFSNINIINKNKIAMPKIGCDSDRLDWEKVKPIIKDVFGDTNLEILICN